VVFRYSEKIRDEVIRVRAAEDVPNLQSFIEDPTNSAFNPPENWWRFYVILTNPLTLLCCFNEAALDGWGRHILFDEIESVIMGRSLPDPVPFRNLVDYAVVESARPDSVQWLASRLSNMDAIPFPVCGDVSTFSAISVLGPNFESAERLSGLTNISRVFSIRSSTLLKVAIALVMRNETKRNSVAFGQIHFCRNLPVEGITQICGLVINSVVDCVDFLPGETVLELLHRTQIAQDEFMDKSIVDFEEVQRVVEIDCNPFFNFLWNLQTQREPTYKTLQPGAVGFDAPLAIIWTTSVDEEDVRIEVNYDPFFSPRIMGYVSQFLEATRWLIANIEAQSVSELQFNR